MTTQTENLAELNRIAIGKLESLIEIARRGELRGFALMTVLGHGVRTADWQVNGEYGFELVGVAYLVANTIAAGVERAQMPVATGTETRN